MEREFIPINIGILRVLETGALADDADVESIVGGLIGAGHAIIGHETVTDSKTLIREQLTIWISDRGIDCIVAIGGADSTPTDPMLDALAPLVTRQFFGFGELFRAIVHEEAGTASIFSHAEAALCNSTYVILLPASGFTRAAIERLLIPQLDHRTKPRNLAMSLPRLAGVPQEQMSDGNTPPPPGQRMTKPPPFPRGTTGSVPVVAAADRTAPLPSVVQRAAPPPPPAVRKSTQQIPAIIVAPAPVPAPPAPAPEPPAEPPAARRPATEPGVAPLPRTEDSVVRRNPFAEALQEAVVQRRTASVVAQMPKPPEPAPAPAPAPAPEAAPAKVVDLGTVDLKALDEAKDGALTLSTSTSGTINVDALVAQVEPEPVKPAPRVTAPPPFVPRTTTQQMAVVPRVTTQQVAVVPPAEPAPEPAKPAPVPEPEPVKEMPPLSARVTAAPPMKAASSGDFAALAVPAERKPERAVPMFKEGRRPRRDGKRLAVIILLLIAGASVVAAGVVVAMSVMRDKRAAAKPPKPPDQPVVNAEPPDASFVPMHDPVVVDAPDIEMPGEPPVDAAPLALKPVVPNHPVPQHDPAPLPDAAVKPLQDDGCDEVSCVLDHYAKPCCAPFKPVEPDPIHNPSKLPEKLDRTMVTAAIEKVKPLVIQCGEQNGAAGQGTVKLSVHVGADGHVTDVSVAATPSNSLGDCVASAVQKATFPATQSGGGFSYPFTF